MQKECLVKILATSIVVLFIGVSFQPILAEETVSIKEESDYGNYSFDEAKEYLFQTLVDISNNPEVKEFLNKYKRELITNNNDNYDFRNAFQKIYKQNPRLLKSILFTKPKVTYEYYETSYKKGLEIIDILSEEESLDLVESVKITNPELFKALNNIIENNDELFNRISVLGKINIDLKSNLTMLERFPIICDILFTCLLAGAIFCLAFSLLIFDSDISILIKIIMAPLYFLCTLPVWFTLYLMLFLNCDFPDIPPY